MKKKKGESAGGGVGLKGSTLFDFYHWREEYALCVSM